MDKCKLLCCLLFIIIVFILIIAIVRKGKLWAKNEYYNVDTESGVGIITSGEGIRGPGPSCPVISTVCRI